MGYLVRIEECYVKAAEVVTSTGEEEQREVSCAVNRKVYKQGIPRTSGQCQVGQHMLLLLSLACTVVTQEKKKLYQQYVQIPSQQYSKTVLLYLQQNTSTIIKNHRGQQKIPKSKHMHGHMYNTHQKPRCTIQVNKTCISFLYVFKSQHQHQRCWQIYIGRKVSELQCFVETNNQILATLITFIFNEVHVNDYYTECRICPNSIPLYVIQGSRT